MAGERHATCISDLLLSSHIVGAVLEGIEEGTSCPLSKQNSLGGIAIPVFVLFPCDNSHIFRKLICAPNGKIKEQILHLSNRILFNVRSSR